MLIKHCLQKTFTVALLFSLVSLVIPKTSVAGETLEQLLGRAARYAAGISPEEFSGLLTKLSEETGEGSQRTNAFTRTASPANYLIEPNYKRAITILIDSLESQVKRSFTEEEIIRKLLDHMSILFGHLYPKENEAIHLEYVNLIDRAYLSLDDALRTLVTKHRLSTPVVDQFVSSFKLRVGATSGRIGENDLFRFPSALQWYISYKYDTTGNLKESIKGVIGLHTQFFSLNKSSNPLKSELLIRHKPARETGAFYYRKILRIGLTQDYQGDRKEAEKTLLEVLNTGLFLDTEFHIQLREMLLSDNKALYDRALLILFKLPQILADRYDFWATPKNAQSNAASQIAHALNTATDYLRKNYSIDKTAYSPKLYEFYSELLQNDMYFSTEEEIVLHYPRKFGTAYRGDVERARGAHFDPPPTLSDTCVYLSNKKLNQWWFEIPRMRNLMFP